MTMLDLEREAGLKEFTERHGGNPVCWHYSLACNAVKVPPDLRPPKDATTYLLPSGARLVQIKDGHWQLLEPPDDTTAWVVLAQCYLMERELDQLREKYHAAQLAAAREPDDGFTKPPKYTPG